MEPTTQPLDAVLAAVRSAKAELSHREASLIADRPEWAAQLDMRITSIESLRNVLRFSDLALAFTTGHLLSLEYWRRSLCPDASLEDIRPEFLAFTETSKFAAFHLTFAAIESSYRAFLRAINPGAYEDATGKFNAVYRRLLHERLELTEEETTVVELMRLIRNTVHNQGVHRTPGKASREITCGGTTYSFVEGKPMDFVTWSFVVARLLDLARLQERVVRHPVLYNYREQIPDASVSNPGVV